MGAMLLQQDTTQPPMKRAHSPSPNSVSHSLRKDFSLLESQVESPGSSPSLESLRRASPPSSPLSLSIAPTSPQRDALLSPPTLNLTPIPIPLPKVLENKEQEEIIVKKSSNSFKSELLKTSASKFPKVIGGSVLFGCIVQVELSHQTVKKKIFVVFILRSIIHGNTNNLSKIVHSIIALLTFIFDCTRFTQSQYFNLLAL